MLHHKASLTARKLQAQASRVVSSSLARNTQDIDTSGRRIPGLFLMSAFGPLGEGDADSSRSSSFLRQAMSRCLFFQLQTRHQRPIQDEQIEYAAPPQPGQALTCLPLQMPNLAREIFPSYTLHYHLINNLDLLHPPAFAHSVQSRFPDRAHKCSIPSNCFPRPFLRKCSSFLSTRNTHQLHPPFVPTPKKYTEVTSSHPFLHSCRKNLSIRNANASLVCEAPNKVRNQAS